MSAHATSAAPVSEDNLDRSFGQNGEAARDKLFITLADRLVQVHRELGDQEATEVWKAKLETGFKAGIEL